MVASSNLVLNTSICEHELPSATDIEEMKVQASTTTPHLREDLVLGRELEDVDHVLGATNHAAAQAATTAEQRERAERNLAFGNAKQTHATIRSRYTHRRAGSVSKRWRNLHRNTEHSVLQDLEVAIPLEIAGRGHHHKVLRTLGFLHLLLARGKHELMTTCVRIPARASEQAG